ncbi:hypothetical protein M9H77_23454 [Catharanthus roseus]|uniref:Uncharacterized protein n=1 Tax=Catharanthus roseus TaxID=4058 RepID=A0ACC0AU27_CATRO|nr:hypothetical protein M9H77_23454 [Catharanthus roseus]
MDNVNSYILSLLSGLCNGTRLIIKRLGESVIEAEAITRIRTRVTYYINKIDMFKDKTFENVGVYLPKAVFCHGQLYVDASTVTSCNRLKFYIDNNGKCEDNIVKNVVYSEIFSNIHEVSGTVEADGCVVGAEDEGGASKCASCSVCVYGS